MERELMPDRRFSKQLILLALASSVWALSAGRSHAKEIKDLSSTEQVALAAVSLVQCFAKPGNAPAIAAAKDEAGRLNMKNVTTDTFEKMKAFLDVLFNQYGREDACKTLFVEGISEKAGSLQREPDSPTAKLLDEILNSKYPRPQH
jgi:hypothetical protein